MQIRLLGTSAAEGWPGLFCECDACRNARRLGGKNLRSRASALIDENLKIDLPPDTLHHVLSGFLDMTKVEHLLFTHVHDDHFAVRELQYSSWMFVPQPITRILNVYGPVDAIVRMREELELNTLPLAVHCLAPWEMAEAGDYEITPILAQHDSERVCLNYLISKGGNTLLYATDTGWWDEATWSFLATRKVDAVVIECTKGLNPNGYKAHLSVPEVIKVRKRLLTDGVIAEDVRFVTTHHSHLSGLLHEELEAHLNPHGIEVGFDGFEFEI
jgi:phosphoribosyl 1,2-cyclic phosphate phosphodiesterase